MTLLLLKVSAVLGFAWPALALLKRHPAATRHFLIVALLTAALAIPALSMLLPGWAGLPARAVAAPVSRTISAAPARAPASAQGEAVVGARPASEQSGPTAPELALLLWACVTGALLLLLTGQMLAMQRRVRRASPLLDARWQRLLDESCSALGLKHSVQLRLVGARAMPAAWGWWRPVVLLPDECLQWPEARCRAVLLHELAHIARGDLATRSLARVACAVYWFHPLVWLLKARLDLEGEQACDDLALGAGQSATRYANYLLDTAADCAQRHSVAPVMAARTQLETRIMAILDTTTPRRRATVRTRLVIAAIAAAVCVPVATLTQAQTSIGSADAVQYDRSDSLKFARHLSALGIDTENVDALLDALGSADPLTRAACAWALGDSGDPRVVQPLAQAAYDVDAVVREWAVRSLERWTGPQVAQVLVDRLQDDLADVRQWAARSFNRHEPAVKSAPLIAALNDADAEVREWAARGLADVGSPPAQQALADRLAVETNAGASEWLVRSLAGDGSGVAALIAATRNASADVRQWAARGLHGRTDTSAVDALLALLDDTDAEVREWSVRALGTCGNVRAEAPLRALRDDPSAEVREWAGRALEAIDC
ncbi:MAG: M56 family metallopeptidase [Pseudomonadota bacterium]